MNQPLAIVGASTRSAAASAVRSGFQPLAADLFADADLRRIATATRISPYPEGLLDWLRAVEPSAWMYTGALENYPELVDQMAWIAPLLGNSGDVLTRVRSPWELAAALRAAGLAFPEIRESAHGIPYDGSWLVKTYRGASGSGVRSLDSEATGELPFDVDAGSAANAVYQRRMAGVPCAAVYIALNGSAAPIGVTRQLIGQPWLNSHGFQYGGSIGPHPVSEKVRNTLVRIGDVLAAEFELVGLFGVDFMLDGDEVWTLEVNPRYTASVEIVERYSGARAIAAHVEACGGGLPPDKQSGPWARPEWWTAHAGGGLLDEYGQPSASGLAHGKAILYAKQDVTLSRKFAEMSLAEAMREPWPTLGDVSPAGTLVDAGRPILTIFASGPDVNEVEQQLRKRVVELEKLLYI